MNGSFGIEIVRNEITVAEYKGNITEVASRIEYHARRDDAFGGILDPPKKFELIRLI